MIHLKLNTEQKLAVLHKDGPCLVTAVPGSGKTRCLTERIAYLVKSVGVLPENILAVTFTNKAADEMKDRVAKSIGQLSKKVWISTFHTLCLAILKKYGHLSGVHKGFSIYDDKDQKALLSKIARMHEWEDCSPSDIMRLQTLVNEIREELINVDSLGNEVDGRDKDIINEYYETLTEFNAVDFSGMLYQTWKVLKNNGIVREKLRNKFKYVLEDEGQDANKIQYEILKFLAPPPDGNIFIVGDACQSIFAFRGAKPENLIKMTQEYNDVKSIILPRNYRSTSNILDLAQKLIRNNERASDVELIAERGSGKHVKVCPCDDPDNEAYLIAQRIKHLRSNYKYSWDDFAVLYRSNHLSKFLEMGFRKYGVPYKIVGGFSFFDRAEIKTALAYLSFFENPHDTIAFNRLISHPKRGVGDVLIGKLERRCQKEKINMLDACMNLENMSKINAKARSSLNKFIALYEKNKDNTSPLDIATSLLRDSGFYSHLEEQSKQDPSHQKRISNVDELLIGIGDFVEQNPSATIADYLQSTQLLNSSDNASEEGVTLLTMHASKGREWPSVHVVGVETNIVPHFKSVAEGDVEEERRLFYVAMTRAQDDLHISYCKTRKAFNKGSKKQLTKFPKPSPFLEEIFEDAF